MTEEYIISIIEKQKSFFNQEKTFSVINRKEILKQLKDNIIYETEGIYDALYADLGKDRVEAYMCEIGMVLSELNFMLKNVSKLSKPHRVKTPISQFLSRSYTICSPYGVTLIMSPWNYPFMLTFEPLIDAVAAGNTVIVKPSAYSPRTSEIIQRIIKKTDPEGKWLDVVTGGREENQVLLNQSFDFIFFTGSVGVGKEVMRKASERLTPITLELGGKSPCIVAKDADIALAAKRIVFGKFLNCGQTCVAPDYVLCHKDIEDSLVCAIKNEIEKQYKNALQSDEYGKIVNKKHFERIIGLIEKEKVVYGGNFDRQTLKIQPTVMVGCSYEDNVMQEEIFGPLLPIIAFDDIFAVKDKLKTLPAPLALYVFSESSKTAKDLTEKIKFGGGCVNDTIIHLATSNMGFGGVGNSGMGSYHGKAGFMNFSNCKSIVNKSTAIDMPMRYKPADKKKERSIRFFLK